MTISAPPIVKVMFVSAYDPLTLVMDKDSRMNAYLHPNINHLYLRQR